MGVGPRHHVRPGDVHQRDRWRLVVGWLGSDFHGRDVDVRSDATRSTDVPAATPARASTVRRTVRAIGRAIGRCGSPAATVVAADPRWGRDQSCLASGARSALVWSVRTGGVDGPRSALDVADSRSGPAGVWRVADDRVARLLHAGPVAGRLQIRFSPRPRPDGRVESTPAQSPGGRDRTTRNPRAAVHACFSW